jgi:hypothetical protein
MGDKIRTDIANGGHSAPTQEDGGHGVMGDGKRTPPSIPSHTEQFEASAQVLDNWRSSDDCEAGQIPFLPNGKDAGISIDQDDQG